MLVHERMSKNPHTITATTTVDEALRQKRDRRIRRLPVLDTSGKLVSIVTEKDLPHVSPSPATSLSTHELHCPLSVWRAKAAKGSGG